MFICWLIIILIAMLVITYNPKNIYSNRNGNENFNISKINVEKCYSSPLTRAKCYQTDYYPCPKKNGSFMQCTNNFKHKTNIANCYERTYYFSPYKQRLSKKCVYNKEFPFAIKKTNYNPYTPSIFPRVNIWRDDNLDNNFFINFG